MRGTRECHFPCVVLKYEKGFITSLRITSLKDQGLLSSSEVLINGHTITTGFPDLSIIIIGLLDSIAGIFPNVYLSYEKYVYRKASEHCGFCHPAVKISVGIITACIKPRKYIIWIRLQ